MITVRETKSGTFERLVGNPTLLSLDGEVKAPLKTICSPTWTPADRAEFGVYLVEPFVVPEGMQEVGPRTYVKGSDGVVVEVATVEDIPAPPPDTRTPEQKVEAMAARFRLTLDELRAVLMEAKQ
jgi:hypothetical protein